MAEMECPYSRGLAAYISISAPKPDKYRNQKRAGFAGKSQGSQRFQWLGLTGTLSPTRLRLRRERLRLNPGFRFEIRDEKASVPDGV